MIHASIVTEGCDNVPEPAARVAVSAAEGGMMRVETDDPYGDALAFDVVDGALELMHRRNPRDSGIDQIEMDPRGSAQVGGRFEQVEQGRGRHEPPQAHEPQAAVRVVDDVDGGWGRPAKPADERGDQHVVVALRCVECTTMSGWWVVVFGLREGPESNVHDRPESASR